MNAFVYWISLPFIYAISLLPFRVLYIISDFLYLVIYKVAGYRTAVVTENLKNAFPEKTEVERKVIRDRFYHFFCDLLLETVKTLTITPSSARKRVIMKDMSVFGTYFDQKRSVIIVTGHLGNWELAGAGFSQLPWHLLYVIYHPMANPYFNRLVVHMRTRLGNRLYAMNETFRGMIQNRSQITATAFIADQTPSAPDTAYWTTFLNQDTPVFNGPAKISKKLNYPLIYISLKRPGRGYYEMSAELLVEDPSRLSEDEISELHTRRLEKDILNQPAHWLWTHRRWKHKRPG